MHEFHQLVAQLGVHIRHPAEHDALLQFHRREGDVQVQAAALEGVGDVPRVVAGQEYHGGGARLDGAYLGDRDLVVGENFQQQRLELVVGLVDLVDQQDGALVLLHGLEQRARLEEILGVKDIAELVQALYGFRQPLGALEQVSQLLLQHLGVQQLLAVFPFVQGLGLVQALVALQAYQLGVEQFGGGLGQLGLADAGRALHQDGLAQLEGQEYGGGYLGAAYIAEGFEASLDLRHGGQLGKILYLHGLTFCRDGSRVLSGVAAATPDRPLAASHVHEADDFRLPCQVEMVTLRFDRHGGDNFPLEVGQGMARVAQHGPQVRGVFVAQAQQQSSLRRYPHPVAQVAEVAAVGRDEAHPRALA